MPSALQGRSGRRIRTPELMSVGPDDAVVSFATDGPDEIATCVGEHEVVTTGPHHLARVDGLEPATEYRIEIEGADVAPEDRQYLPETVTTLARPTGRQVATVATVNDVHFGEVECGKLEGWGEELVGPVFTSDPGGDPYPEIMNRGAIGDIEALDPDAVVVKGDLTSMGTEQEYEAFLDAYQLLGARMHHVRGNHDAQRTDAIGVTAPFAVELSGVTLAVLDTVRPRHHSGQVTADQIDWLDGLAEASAQPVLVFGHHNIWNLHSNHRNPDYFGINPDDSEALIAVVSQREAIAGYFAGHTHRNRVRRFAAARDVPFVEVACVKDYPGAWAEYRIYEGGYTQVMRRISSPGAMAWTEKTREMFHGLYRDYALGPLDWRCFTQVF